MSEIIIIIVRFAHRKLRSTMANLDEYQMFAPPSTAGSSNTLTLSSGSSGVASHGFATPLVAKNLFSSDEKIPEEEREMNDDDELDDDNISNVPEEGKKKRIVMNWSNN